jgi:putative polyhydroxyalkanoate system protein
MIIVRRHHDLGLAKAKRLAETVTRQLQADYGGSYAWKGNDLHFRRTGASGRVSVTKDGFEVRVELGFLLSALRSRIEREVRAFCDENLGVDEPPDPGSAGTTSAAGKGDTGSSRSSAPRSARRSHRSG